MKLNSILNTIGLLLAAAVGYLFAGTYSNLALFILIGGCVCWFAYMIYDIHQLVQNDSEIFHHLSETKSLIQEALEKDALVPPRLFKRSKIDFEKLN